MILLVVIFIVIGWFSAGILISFFAIRIAKSRGWINGEKRHLPLSVILPFIIFILPAVPNVISYYYVFITMPFVCERMPGNEELNPVVITSFASGEPLSAVNIQNIEIAEWRQGSGASSSWGRSFGEGLYEFEFYPEGAQECRDLLALQPNISKIIDEKRDELVSIGYPLNAIVGQCVGVKDLGQSKVKYYFLSDSESGVSSGFGYSIGKKIVKLIESGTGNVISQRYTISANFPTFIIPQSEGRPINCENQMDLASQYSSGTKNDVFLKNLSDRRAFFKFHTNNN